MSKKFRIRFMPVSAYQFCKSGKILVHCVTGQGRWSWGIWWSSEGTGRHYVLPNRGFLKRLTDLDIQLQEDILRHWHTHSKEANRRWTITTLMEETIIICLNAHCLYVQLHCTLLNVYIAIMLNYYTVNTLLKNQPYCHFIHILKAIWRWRLSINVFSIYLGKLRQK